MAASSCSPRRAAGARSWSQSTSRQRSAHSAWRSSGEMRIASTIRRRRATKPEDFTFDAAEVLRRVDEQGDLFAPVLTLVQRLPGA